MAGDDNGPCAVSVSDKYDGRGRSTGTDDLTDWLGCAAGRDLMLCQDGRGLKCIHIFSCTNRCQLRGMRWVGVELRHCRGQKQIAAVTRMILRSGGVVDNVGGKLKRTKFIQDDRA